MNSLVELNNFDPSLGLNRGASRSKELIWYLFKMLFFLTAVPFPSRFKVVILKMFGAKIGSNVVIKPRVNIHFPWKLVLGNNVWIGEETFMLNFEDLKIGNNVCVSQRAFLCGGNHDYKSPSMPYRNGSIYLSDGCWIGACVFVGADVVIGVDSVIFASSVVTKSVDSNGVYGGNPLVLIKKRW